MHRQEQLTMDDNQQAVWNRRLRDKYIDKYGYKKKIIVDDVLSQFWQVQDSIPSAIDLKDLDIVMKKRTLGKEAIYEARPPPQPKGKRPQGLQNDSRLAQSSILPTEKSEKKNPQPPKIKKIPKREDPDEVTGKIGSMPAPRIKKKKTKESEPVSDPLEKSKLHPGIINKIMNGETEDLPKSKKNLNKWGLLNLAVSQEYEAEKIKKKQDDLELAQAYRKVLDEQIQEKKQLQKFEDVQTKALAIKNRKQRPEDVEAPCPTNRAIKNERNILKEYSQMKQELESNEQYLSRGSLFSNNRPQSTRPTEQKQSTRKSYRSWKGSKAS